MGKHSALPSEQRPALLDQTYQELIGMRHERDCTPRHRLDSPVDYLPAPHLSTTTTDRTNS